MTGQIWVYDPTGSIRSDDKGAVETKAVGPTQGLMESEHDWEKFKSQLEKLPKLTKKKVLVGKNYEVGNPSRVLSAQSFLGYSFTEAIKRLEVELPK